jgi:hypothetical protein
MRFERDTNFKSFPNPDVSANARNPNYLRDRRIVVQSQTGQKLAGLCVKNSQMWWYIPVIPATQKVEVEGLWSKAGQCKSMRLTEKQTKRKRAGNLGLLENLSSM